MNHAYAVLAETLFRPAVRGDSRKIAELFRISSGGVADYVWSMQGYPDLSLIEIGAMRYAREETDFSFSKCVIAEFDGGIAGMLHGYPLPPRAANDDSERIEELDPVLRPYAQLEVPESYHVSGLAVAAGCRDQGIGTMLLTIARDRARATGMRRLSLLVFEQNAGAVRLFGRHGFRVTDRRHVVHHPMIRYGGNVLLMEAEA